MVSFTFLLLFIIFFVLSNYTFAVVLRAAFFGVVILDEVIFDAAFFGAAILGATVAFLTCLAVLGAAFFVMFLL